MPKLIDLSGWRFGKLLVIKRWGKNPRAEWLCRCDCGYFIKARTDALRSGATKSCGCLKIAKFIKMAQSKEIRERIRKLQTIHGKAGTVEYKTWHAMVNRCHNKKSSAFGEYGGRGIKVYKPWRKSFTKFYKYLLKTIGLRPSKGYSIDRIDNDGNYEPGNIRWATAKQQMNNRRPKIKFYAKSKRLLSRWKNLD